MERTAPSKQSATPTATVNSKIMLNEKLRLPSGVQLTVLCGKDQHLTNVTGVSTSTSTVPPLSSFNRPGLGSRASRVSIETRDGMLIMTNISANSNNTSAGHGNQAVAKITGLQRNNVHFPSIGQQFVSGSAVQIDHNNIMSYPHAKIGQSTIVKQTPVIQTSQIGSTTVIHPLTTTGPVGGPSGAPVDVNRRFTTVPASPAVKIYRSIAPKSNVVVSPVTTNLQSLMAAPATSGPVMTPMAVPVNSAPTPLVAPLIMQPMIVTNATQIQQSPQQQQQPTLIATGSSQLHNLVLPLGTTIKVTPTGIDPQQHQLQTVSIPVSKPQLHTIVRPISPMPTSVVSIPLTQQQTQQPHQQLSVGPNKVLLNTRPMPSAPARTIVTTNIPPLYVPPNKGTMSVSGVIKPMMLSTSAGHLQTAIDNSAHKIVLDGTRINATEQIEKISQRRMSVNVIRNTLGLGEQTGRLDTLPPLPKLTPFSTPRVPQLQQVRQTTTRLVPVPTTVPVPSYPSKIQPIVSQPESTNPKDVESAEGNVTSNAESPVEDMGESHSGKAQNEAGGSKAAPESKRNPEKTEEATIQMVVVSEDSNDQSLEKKPTVTTKPSETVRPREGSPKRTTAMDNVNVSPRLQKRSISEHQKSTNGSAPSYVVPEKVIIRRPFAIRRRYSELATHPPGVSLSVPFQNFIGHNRGNFQSKETVVPKEAKTIPFVPGANVVEKKRKEQPVSPDRNELLLCGEKLEVVNYKERKNHNNNTQPAPVKPIQVLNDLFALDGQKNGLPQRDEAESDFKKKPQQGDYGLDEDVDGATNQSTSTSSSESNLAAVKSGRAARKQQISSRGAKNAGTSVGRSPQTVATNTTAASESSLSAQDECGSLADTTTVSEHLHWHDGIGYLKESLLHFEFNMFGMVQPITAEEYDRHCATDVYEHLHKPLDARTSSSRALPAKRPRQGEDNVMYQCVNCRGRGFASDFVTPDYCSIYCIHTSSNPALRRYILTSTLAFKHKNAKKIEDKTQGAGDAKAFAPLPLAGEEQSGQQQQGASNMGNDTKPVVGKKRRKGTNAGSVSTTITTTSDEDSMSSLSLNSSTFLKRQEFGTMLPATLDADIQNLPLIIPGAGGDGGEDTEFDWSRYLKQVKAEAAPIRLFGPNPFPVVHNEHNGFAVGMKLEAIDPENNSLFCVCTVAEVRGYRIKLHFDGYPAEYDFWVNADSNDIFPAGWCKQTNRILQPPADYRNRTFNWEHYLRETGATVPDHRYFPHLNKKCEKSQLEVGMSLEADDLKKSGKVCVASIADKIGNRILVHFDGWDDRYDYWVNVHSNYIHPVNWHQDNNDKITAPPDWSKTFDWGKYLHIKSRIARRPIVPAAKSMFKTRSPICFKPGQRLEVVDRKQKKLIRPATVVATDGYEVRLCFDGWPRSYSFWIEDDSPDLHPIHWCSRTKHPLEPPPNHLFETATYDGTCEIKFCLGRGNAKFPNKKFHDRPMECPYKRSNWMGEDRKPLRISHNQIIKKNIEEPEQLNDKPGNSNPGGDVNDVKEYSTTSVKMETAVASRPASVTPTGPGLSKRIKRENEEPPTSSVSSSQTPTPSSSRDPSKEGIVRVKDAKELVVPRTKTSTSDGSIDLLQQESIRLALPVIDEYGPRLLHSYEVWRKHSRYLDECNVRSGGTEDLRKNPLNWTTDEMARYIERVPGCGECAQRIRHEEITGKSFLSFTQNDLMNYLGVKVGPAIKIYNRIIRLRQLVTTKFIQL